MHNILNQTRLPRLEILQNQRFILFVVASVIAIVVFALIVIILKRRKSKKIVNINLTDTKEPSDKTPEEHHKFIAERIVRTGKKYKSILFTSAEPESLPITIPINVSITLAKNKKRCLLIDLDTSRDAIAEAFELDTGTNILRPKSVQTKIENLWVLPGHNFAQLKQMNIKAIAQNARKRFDFIIINSPSLLSNPDRRQVISAAQAAFICTKGASEATKLTKLIKPLRCAVIGNIQIPQGNSQQ